MSFIENLGSNMPVIAGLVALILLILFLTALMSWRLCKRTFSDLLEGAEGRATIAEERARLADERTILSDERVDMLREKLESLQPENFDAKIDDIVSRIKDVEYSRLSGIISQLNEIKVGEPQTKTVNIADMRAEHGDLRENVPSQDNNTSEPTTDENAPTTDEDVPTPANEDVADAYEEIFEPEQDDVDQKSGQNLISA